MIDMGDKGCLMCMQKSVQWAVLTALLMCSYMHSLWVAASCKLIATENGRHACEVWVPYMQKSVDWAVLNALLMVVMNSFSVCAWSNVHVESSLYTCSEGTHSVVKTTNFYFGRDIALSSRGWGQCMLTIALQQLYNYSSGTSPIPIDSFQIVGCRRQSHTFYISNYIILKLLT